MKGGTRPGRLRVLDVRVVPKWGQVRTNLTRHSIALPRIWRGANHSGTRSGGAADLGRRRAQLTKRYRDRYYESGMRGGHKAPPEEGIRPDELAAVGPLGETHPIPQVRS